MKYLEKTFSVGNRQEVSTEEMTRRWEETFGRKPRYPTTPETEATRTRLLGELASLVGHSAKQWEECRKWLLGEGCLPSTAKLQLTACTLQILGLGADGRSMIEFFTDGGSVYSCGRIETLEYDGTVGRDG